MRLPSSGTCHDRRHDSVGSTSTAWQDALTRLRQADLSAIRRIFRGYTHPDLFVAIDVSVEALAGPDQERYLDLAVFPQEQPIPQSALRALWGLEETKTRDCMGRFVARSLATRKRKGTLCYCTTFSAI